MKTNSAGKNYIVLATGNRGKLVELAALLDTQKLIAQSELGIAPAAENGETFVDNAIIKARHACKYSGGAAIADDSGLEVDALDGAPGILSARYAGRAATDADNRIKLLNKLRQVKLPNRTARFRCAIVYMRNEHDNQPLICNAVWQGMILLSPRGNNGFGYDSIFFIPHLNKSAAQLTADEKNKISHRAKAAGKLKALLELPNQ